MGFLADTSLARRQATNSERMEIKLSEQDELIVQRLLKTGAFVDRAAVLSSALVALDKHHRQVAMDEAIQHGLDSGIDESFGWADLKAEAKASIGCT